MSDLRDGVRQLVQWPSGPVATHAVDVRPVPADGMRREEVWLEGHPRTRATVLLPPGDGPFPTILYCHGHGDDFDLGRREVLEGARWLDRPLGAEMVRLGFAVVAADALGFGADRDRDWTETMSAKSLMWWGQGLFAETLQQLAEVLGYALSRPDVDRARVYTFGVSTGAAQAWWLAALDDRVAGAAHGCMLADMERLIADGSHDHHGIHLIVPGLLRVCDMGHVAGLVAPRPQFVAAAESDPMTPDAARRAAHGRLTHAYRAAPDRLWIHVEPGDGHRLTTGMADAALAFLARTASEGRPT